MIRLKEVVPFSQTDVIGKGLGNKYKDMDEGTFGVEIEAHTFDPRYAEENPRDYADYFASEMRYNNFAKQAYEEWVEDIREKENRRYRGDSWDDSHGPVDPDTWERHNPRPEREHYPLTIDGGQDEFDDALSQWKSEFENVDWKYRKWDKRDREDYIDEWIYEVIDDGSWQNYFEVPEQEPSYDEEAEEQVRDFIEKETGGKFGNSGWDIGKDSGDIMEVRTPPMTYTRDNLDLLWKVMEFIYTNFYPGGDTSAHVHVGMGEDSTIFDLLAATTLVDEKAVRKDISKDRELSKFSALSGDVHDRIINALAKYLDSTGERKLIDYVGKSFMIKNSSLKEFVLSTSTKHSGTNIKSFFKHKTLEFRYFSSQIATNFDIFEKWIKYFLLIPKVARSRNWFMIGDDKENPLVFTREKKEYTRITIMDKRGKIPRGGSESPHSIRFDKPETQKMKDLLKQKHFGSKQGEFKFAKIP